MTRYGAGDYDDGIGYLASSSPTVLKGLPTELRSKLDTYQERHEDQHKSHSD
jgi:hypothetical protein